MNRACRLLASAAGVLFALAAVSSSAAESTGTVTGKIRVDLPGIDLSTLGPVVVYLDSVGTPVSFTPPTDEPEISQKGAKFEPSFLLVTNGQTVRIPNDDSIVHNAFSYSRPNAFDLGLYPKGDARTITVREPGPIRIYCSIHKSMNAMVFATPLPWRAIADRAGAFRIDGAPPGHYRAVMWNERLPESAQPVDVAAGQTSNVEISVGGSTR